MNPEGGNGCCGASVHGGSVCSLDGRSGHAVQFYENESALVAVVSDFFKTGILEGQDCIFIGTAAHREAVQAQLTLSGFSIENLQQENRCVFLDAAETMSQIMRGQTPDSALFRQTVGKLVAEHAASGKAVRAFGEMVALLWEQNNRPAAIKLEEFWNELCAEHSFSLLCAYPISGFPDQRDGEPLEHVCDKHSHVIPAESIDQTGMSADAMRTIARLQQKAAALEAEVARRKETELQLRDLVENATEGIHQVGPDGTIIWANKAELDLLGYSAEEYFGRKITDFHADNDVIEDILQRLKRGEKLTNYYARLRHKDGSIKHVLINSSVRWDNGRFGYTKCFTRDITDRQAAQVAQELLSSIVASSDDAIISKDLNGIITSWNKGAERVFGYTAEEVIGKPVTILMPPERVDEEPGILARLRRGEPIDHYETIRRRKDGKLLNISLTVSPMRNERGEIFGASKVARDITDRVRAKEKLEELVSERTRALRDVVAELESFSYSIAHDMRAPLRSMRSYAQILQEDYSQILDEEARDFLDRIASSAQRLDALITDVLNYSRIIRGEMPLEVVNIEHLTRDVIDSYPNLKANGAVITVQPGGPLVLANTAALTQCVSNLLANAVKFVAPGTIPNINVRSEMRAGFVRTIVEDNGIGISEEGQRRIFHMFNRLNPSSTFEGTGIGLTIVRKAVERMGGRVGVRSKLGSGSQFWFELRPAFVERSSDLSKPRKEEAVVSSEVFAAR